MKTNITFRSTLSNTSWLQRGAAALLMAALIIAFTLVLRPNIHAPASTPAARQAAPATHDPHVPVMGAGSAYDGSAYVEYLTGRSTASNPRVPVIGAGSAYDGGAHGTERLATRNPRVPVIGAGSAYDGGAYGTERPATRNPNVPVIGAGSAYDGQ